MKNSSCETKHQLWSGLVSSGHCNRKFTEVVCDYKNVLNATFTWFKRQIVHANKLEWLGCIDGYSPIQLFGYLKS